MSFETHSVLINFADQPNANCTRCEGDCIDDSMNLVYDWSTCMGNTTCTRTVMQSYMPSCGESDKFSDYLQVEYQCVPSKSYYFTFELNYDSLKLLLQVVLNDVLVLLLMYLLRTETRVQQNIFKFVTAIRVMVLVGQK